MNDRWIGFDWRGRTAHAWSPARLVEREFRLPEQSVRRTERALAELRLMEERLVPGAEAIGRLLLRSEGIASSAIEGLSVPVGDVLAVEAIGSGAAAATWVARNLAVVTAAVEETVSPLDADQLHRWHQQLMEGSDLDTDLQGAWRQSPGWVGGNSPLDAAYVPPPAVLIPDLMADLVDFANGTRYDPISQAAIAHAQFETIHPYGDGNGRIGRVLVGWILRRRGAVERYPPPVSVTILRDTGGYLAGLYDFREGDPIRWIDWLAARTVAAASAASDLHGLVGALVERWRSSVQDVRADSVVHRILELLPTFPVLSATAIANTCGVSRRTALTALDTLERHGVLQPFRSAPPSRGRPTRWWIANELVQLTQTWLT